MSSWVGTDLTVGLRQRMGLGVAVPVEIRNDVDAHTLGESWLGAGRGRGSLLMVAVGTGVGAGLMLDGRLRTGTRHVAGEMGHMPVPGAENLRCACGRFGHLEAIAAGPAMERRYVAAGGAPASGPEIMAKAEAGEGAAAEIVEAAAVALGRSIAGVVTVVDPDCVIVGGGVAEAGEVWWGPLRAACRNDLIDRLADIEILPAELGTSAALLGAARTIFDRAEE